MVPVREDGVAGPDGADVETAVGVFEEEVVCGAAVIGWVAELLVCCMMGKGEGGSRIRCIVGVGDVEGRVDERDEAAATGVQLVEEFLALFVGPVGLFVVKVAVSVHVIDINPDNVSANTDFSRCTAYQMYSTGISNFSKSAMTFSRSAQPVYPQRH